MMLHRTAQGDRLPSDWGFRFMAVEFKARDFLRPRNTILNEAGIKPGYKVLDYGCGPGSYIMPLSKLVGDTGRVYALDAHPLAIKMVRNMISRKHLTNAETILSEGATGLSDESLDVVLLYDTLHDLGDPDYVLGEIHRTLKFGRLLSLSDHHLKEAEIISKLTEKGLFTLASKGKRTYRFTKI